jgi:hypothetical protein
VKGNYGAFEMGHTYIGDHFFVTDVLAPNATEHIDLSLPPMGNSRDQSEPPLRKLPHPTAYVAFVEFADGTYWGDLQEARDILQDRVASWQRLNDLQQIYRLRGQEAFSTELMGESHLIAVEWLQGTFKEKGAAAAIAQLNDMLSAAAAHRDANTPHR